MAAIVDYVRSMSRESRETFLRSSGAKAEVSDFLHEILLRSMGDSLIGQATIAFANSASTSTVAPLIERSSDMEPLVMLGDAYFAGSNIEQAEQTYAQAIRKFVQDDAPSRDIIWLAKAATRWESALLRGGACKSLPDKIPSWNAVWAPLGVPSDYDICSLLQYQKEKSGHESNKPGLLNLIYPVIAESLRRCGDTARDKEVENIKVLECLYSADPDFPMNASGSGLMASSTSLDEQIAVQMIGDHAN